MKKLFFSIILFPLFTVAQELSTVTGIDSIVSRIDTDSRIVKKTFDTSTYIKADGGTRWDSMYRHKELFYQNGKLVKAIVWSKYRGTRHDMVAYYIDDKTVKFSDGNSFIGQPDNERLNFAIYYYKDKDIKVEWLTTKPTNVLGEGVVADIFLKWAYQLQSN